MACYHKLTTLCLFGSGEIKIKIMSASIYYKIQNTKFTVNDSIKVKMKCYTVMIRFSARGANLLLTPQERALIRDRALIYFFEKRPNV